MIYLIILLYNFVSVASSYDSIKNQNNQSYDVIDRSLSPIKPAISENILNIQTIESIYISPVSSESFLIENQITPVPRENITASLMEKIIQEPLYYQKTFNHDIKYKDAFTFCANINQKDCETQTDFCVYENHTLNPKENIWLKKQSLIKEETALLIESFDLFFNEDFDLTEDLKPNNIIHNVSYQKIQSANYRLPVITNIVNFKNQATGIEFTRSDSIDHSLRQNKAAAILYQDNIEYKLTIGKLNIKYQNIKAGNNFLDFNISLIQNYNPLHLGFGLKYRYNNIWYQTKRTKTRKIKNEIFGLGQIGININPLIFSYEIHQNIFAAKKILHSFGVNAAYATAFNKKIQIGIRQSKYKSIKNCKIYLKINIDI